MHVITTRSRIYLVSTTRDAAAYQSSDDDSTDVASGQFSASVRSSPAKPLSAIEEKKKRGFYPISWRVIGGGVMDEWET